MTFPLHPYHHRDPRKCKQKVRDNSRPEDKLSRKIKNMCEALYSTLERTKICAKHYKAHIKEADNQNLVRNTTTHKRNNMQS